MEDHWTDHAAEPVFNTRIPATGPDGNIFAILGNATRMMRDLKIPADRIERLYEDVMDAESYDQAVAFVERWFPVDRGAQSAESIVDSFVQELVASGGQSEPDAETRLCMARSQVNFAIGCLSGEPNLAMAIAALEDALLYLREAEL